MKSTFFYSKYLFLTLIISLPAYSVNTDNPVERDERSDKNSPDYELNQSVARAKVKSNRSWQTVGYQLKEIKDKTLQLADRKGKAKILTFNWEIEEVYLNPTLPLPLVLTYDKGAFESEFAEYGAAPPWYDCEPFLIDLKTGERVKFDGTIPDEKADEKMTVCRLNNPFKNIWSTKGTYALLGGSESIVNSKDLLPLLTGRDSDISVMFMFGNVHRCGGVIDSWRWLTDTALSFSGGTCGTFINYLFNVKTGELEKYCSSVQKPGYGCPFKPASQYFERVQQLKNAIK